MESKKTDKIKSCPLRVFSSEEDLENMIKNRDQFVSKMGLETYLKLKSQLENHIKEKNTKK